MTLGPAVAARAQAPKVQPSKVAASLVRVFGRGSVADSVLLDDEPVLRVRRGEERLGFAVVRNVTGKEQAITFLVAVDTLGVLKDVDVLIYREPYGGEVAYEAWRKQFRGKTADSPLEVDRDIRGISGATISVHAVTQGVRRALLDLARWSKAGRLR